MSSLDVQVVLASHAASLQRGYLCTAGPRDEAVPPLTWNSGPAGAGTTQFCRDVSAVRFSRSDRLCCEHPQSDKDPGQQRGNRRLDFLFETNSFAATE